MESKEALDLLDSINPELLVSTYPVNFFEATLLKAAKKRGAKTIIHLLSWDNISCKGRFPQLADEYIVWGFIMKTELKDYYNVPEDKIHICGVPHFDLHIKSRQNPKPQPFLKTLGLDYKKPYLFFGMSSPRFAPKEIDIVEWLAVEIRKNMFGKDMQLIVRPHPQNVQGSMADLSWIPRLKAINGERVGIDFPKLVDSKMPWSMQHNDMYKLSHLLAGCVVSLNSGSTLSIDALMCGVPVVLTSFDGDYRLSYWRSVRRLLDYNHLKKLIDLGGVSLVCSYKEMLMMISTYLNDSDYNLQKRLLTIEKECSNFRDLSTENITNTFLFLLNSKTNNYENY